MTCQSVIYRGIVAHKRVRPKRHKLRYNVYSLLLDLSELEQLDKKLRFFSYNRWGLVSFYDKDHGARRVGELFSWVKKQLEIAKIDSEGVRISLLCYPRIFGYVFNPISIYFCYNAENYIVAIFYEVSNTFHETHTYVFEVNGLDQSIIRQTCSKKLYVSPFVGMDAQYYFKICPPGDKISVSIHESDDDGIFLTAVFAGKKVDLTDLQLFKCLIQIPFMTLKVILGIHFEALRLWLKGLPIFIHKAKRVSIETSNYPSEK